MTERGFEDGPRWCYDWQGEGGMYAWHVASVKCFAQPTPVGKDKSQTGWGLAGKVLVVLSAGEGQNTGTALDMSS